MPRIVERTAQDLLLTIQVVDDVYEPITGLVYDSAGLAVHWRLSASVAWQAVTLVAGTLGTWSSGGWIEIGEGLYQLGLPNAAILPGDSTIVRLTNGSYPKQYDSVDAVAVGPDGLTVTVPTSVLTSYTAELGESVAYRGTRWESTMEGVASIVGATAIYFAVKQEDVVDADALIQVRLPLNGSGGSTGLIRVNKGVPADSTDAVIVHTTYLEEGETLNRFVCTVEGEATSLVPASTQLRNQVTNAFPVNTTLPSYYTEWKIVGDADIVLGQGLVAVNPDINRVVS